VNTHHHHACDENYFIDQLCTAALAAAFGLICLALYFSHQAMLYLLLGQQFHPFVLGSGIALVFICSVRGMSFWREWRRRTAVATVCRHGNGHPHSHCPAEHGHPLAPWRYGVVFVPILLFLLGLPSRGPALGSPGPVYVDFTDEAAQAAALAGLDGWSQLGLLAHAAGDENEEEAIPVDFRRLEAMSSTQADRHYWKAKTVKVKGQYLPMNDRAFHLAKFKIGCCFADAQRMYFVVIARDSITHVSAGQWIAVTARIDFRPINGEIKAVLLVSNRGVRPTSPDLNPYERF
jgi:hypothetical protein